ncbi:glycosyl transferase group 1 [Anaeromyxobacter dehalogenans 2CP-1]|uniref:Glycosyl transferase group 1 n=1 Tax=Anaeromyxobacter dehalogenans (strain ATCC BAA-258 / DSM 21875 / 2CP-1) TaxID=455488 RepID=B8JCN4_ANAD2|nr:glycosyltransferase family 4 protein [Anaeromyxobacter dehalogenans]ACL67754.1 glycosyl transferase group 1 [Anaeromyxobacter dehalogenans 2CP-1]
MPARVLFVVNSADFFLSHRLPIAMAARAAGFEVHVATPDSVVGVPRIRAEGFEHHAFPLGRRSLAVWTELRSIAALVALYRRIRPSVVHHVALKAVLYGSIAARLTRVPRVVNAVTGLGYLFSQEGARGAVIRAAALAIFRPVLRSQRVRVIFQNPDDQAEFVRAGVIRPEQAVLIRGSGVDMRQYAPHPEPSGPPLVVFASRMLWDKGVAEFVEAAQLLKAKGSPARFALVGDTDENPAAVPAERLREWHERGIVEWWGRRSDMPQVFAQSALVVLPSVYREGVPKVLIEAAACGRPIVTTDTPGCREIVRDGVNGFLVPPRDGGAVAAAVEKLVASAELRRELGAESRRLAESEFAIDFVVRSTLELYGTAPATSAASVDRRVVG